MSSALDSSALLWALALYRRQLLPTVWEEQRRWLALASRVPDPSLRDAANRALREKGANAEATAVFGILAPRARRAAATRAMTALQTTVDYLDVLGEEPCADPLSDGLALHKAVEEGVSPESATSDWYRFHPHGDDGGYLAELVAACRRELAALPAWDVVAEAGARSAQRCAQGQSLTHAAIADGGGRLRAWAEKLAVPNDYLWWEVAAGASSSVAVHALIAAAADRGADSREAALIEAAYFPPIGALTVLLDDLVDLEQDRLEGEHNYLGYCSEPAIAADRLAFLARRAREAVAPLRRRHRHAAILAGVAGFYLASHRGTDDRFTPIRRGLLESLGGSARLALAAVRLPRHD